MRGIGIEHGLEVYYVGRPLMSVADAWAMLELLFDAGYYARSCPDLAADQQTLAHYVAAGWREGRNPAEFFDTRQYLADNPYLIELDFCPLLHYALSGAGGGKLPSHPESAGRAKTAALFDAAYYCRAYPDVGFGGDPLRHYLNEGWRRGLNPSARFDTGYYLDANPDVRAAGLCPLLHYAAEGRAQGRLPTPPRDPAEIAAAGCLPLSERLRGDGRPVPEGRVGVAALGAAIRTSGSGVVLSLSHDDYVETIGGLQNCVADEERAFVAAGFRHVHLSPARPLIVLAETGGTEFPVAVRVDGRRLGIAAIGDVAAALAAERREAAPLYLVIHHLMGFAPEAVIATARRAAPDRTVILIHDLFTLCPQFAMLRDNVAFCGGPPPGSPTCASCHYGAERPEHRRQVAALFEVLEPEVLADSEAVAGFWRARAGFRHKGVTVVAPARLALDPEFRPARREPPLHIGFLGGPSFHKGWDVFEELASRHFGDPRYRFFQLGFSAEAQRRNVRHVRVTVSARDRDAMIREVMVNDLDVVINWSRCHETFSFTGHEAVAGGALVIARRAAGNVWPSLSQRAIDRAVALDSEDELFALFASGKVLDLDLRRRYGTLTPTSATAAFLLSRPPEQTVPPG